ncbi:MAG: 16S rRNA (adenine(1518)-N(6)/adenine(1519)-N(6))-dimethyltransferase RsmA [Patescibacteria group bacterium]
MRVKKSLGQNFLKSKKALFDVVQAGEVKKGETVLEVGPGKGALTEALLRVGARVIAVEKDAQLIPYLEKRFEETISSGRLVIIEGDILEFNPKKPIGLTYVHRLNLWGKRYKVVANIPYYITGELIRFFLEHECPPSSMTLLLQKEVAERIMARDKKESMLSISVKVYGTPKYYGKVPARYFSPQPKVDSAIISIKNIHSPFKNEKERNLFFKIVRAGFSHKRKMLAGNLSQLFPKEKILEVFKYCNVSEKVRAENLNIEKWQYLTKKLGSSDF